MPVFITILLMSAGAGAMAGNLHYLELVNTAPASVSAFAIADAGSENWRDVPLGTMALHGGGDSTTIGIVDAAGCRHDLRATFADGRVLIQRSFDVCKYRSYHIGPYLRRAEPGEPPARP